MSVPSCGLKRYIVGHDSPKKCSRMEFDTKLEAKEQAESVPRWKEEEPGGAKHLNIQAVIDGSIPGRYTWLQCRIVRIGSYTAVPTEEVNISAIGVQMRLPSSDGKTIVTVSFDITEIEEVMTHVGYRMPVLFFDVCPEAAERIRVSLKMDPIKGPYYDPTTQDYSQKFITLLPSRMQNPSVVTSLFEKDILHYLDYPSANSLLMKSSPKEKDQKMFVEIETELGINRISRIRKKLDNSGVCTEIIKRQCTSLRCRIIHIGAYKNIVPVEEVVISTTGVRICVPSDRDAWRIVTLLLDIKEITKVLIHFGSKMPVIFLDLYPGAAARTRHFLKMDPIKGPYYDPVSKDDTQKYIILFPDKPFEENKVSKLKAIFDSSKVLQELNFEEANGMLMRAAHNESWSKTIKGKDLEAMNTLISSSRNIIQDSGRRARKNLSKLFAEIHCQRIYIGSTWVLPTEDVFISYTRMMLCVACEHDESLEMTLSLDMEDIVKVLAQFGNRYPVLYLQLYPDAAAKIKNSLISSFKMEVCSKPTKQDDIENIITLLCEPFSELNKVTLRAIFRNVYIFRELSAIETSHIMRQISQKVLSNSACKQVVGVKMKRPRGRRKEVSSRHNKRKTEEEKMTSEHTEDINKQSIMSNTVASLAEEDHLFLDPLTGSLQKETSTSSVQSDTASAAVKEDLILDPVTGCFQKAGELEEATPKEKTSTAEETDEIEPMEFMSVQVKVEVTEDNEKEASLSFEEFNDEIKQEMEFEELQETCDHFDGCSGVSEEYILPHFHFANIPKVAGTVAEGRGDEDSLSSEGKADEMEEEIEDEDTKEFYLPAVQPDPAFVCREECILPDPLSVTTSQWEQRGQAQDSMTDKHEAEAGEDQSPSCKMHTEAAR